MNSNYVISGTSARWFPWCSYDLSVLFKVLIITIHCYLKVTLPPTSLCKIQHVTRGCEGEREIMSTTIHSDIQQFII